MKKGARLHLHEKDAANHRRLMLHNDLKDVTNSEHVAGINEQLVRAENEHANASDEAPCSFCEQPIEQGLHVSVQIECIVVPGAAYPLVKDYPQGLHPHFYVCFSCAREHSLVTQKELDTGRPE